MVGPAMRLHYLPGTAAMAPHATLAEIGVPYELVRVERDADQRVSEEYLALNPWGKIPTLEDGDVVLTESAAICLYPAGAGASGGSKDDRGAGAGTAGVLPPQRPLNRQRRASCSPPF